MEILWGLDRQRGVPDLEKLHQRIHPEDHDSEIEYAERAVRAGIDFSQEFRIVLHDENLRLIHEVGHPVFSACGTVIEVVGTHVDITERKRIEEERARLRKLKAELAYMDRLTMLGELAGSLAHEINQPIAVTITNACLRWLMRRPLDFERVRAATKESRKTEPEHRRNVSWSR